MMDNEHVDGPAEGQNEENLHIDDPETAQGSSDIEDTQEITPEVLDTASNPDEEEEDVSEALDAPAEVNNDSESIGKSAEESNDLSSFEENEPLEVEEGAEEDAGIGDINDQEQDEEFSPSFLPDDFASEEGTDPQTLKEDEGTTEGEDTFDDAGGWLESSTESDELIESSTGWWGDVPFTPIDSLNDDETQPVDVSKADLQVSGEQKESNFGAETRAISSDLPSDVDKGIDGDIPETRVIPIGGERTSSDDIPTIPPPYVPPGWVPENPNLPKSVSEVDKQATRVTPAAYQSTSRKAQDTDKIKVRTKNKKVGNSPKSKRPKKTKGAKKFGGCLLRAVLFFIFLLILAGLVVGSIGIYQYFRISSSLPDVNELRDRAAQFETTRILDRDGHLLYEIIDPNAGRRTYVPLEDVSPELIAATIATEDKDFFTNPGFDLLAMSRALFQNYTAGEIQSGASTITQQLARALLLDPTERYEQSYSRKAREIVLAYEITRQYTKEEILELYLNENFYGNNSYGVQAAAETYFNTSAEELNLWQSSFLAGLPQGPSFMISTQTERRLYTANGPFLC